MGGYCISLRSGNALGQSGGHISMRTDCISLRRGNALGPHLGAWRGFWDCISLRSGNALGLKVWMEPLHAGLYQLEEWQRARATMRRYAARMDCISLRSGNALGLGRTSTRPEPNCISLRSGNALGLLGGTRDHVWNCISLRSGNALGPVSTGKRQPPIAETIFPIPCIASWVSSGMVVNRS